ncbi:hypothetical protein [Psychrobacter cryohalolentis]|uniref:hypothetical protein n=1 Tax=Psychrobacter cryohalolentis TaxID=330922 RepID=UPI003F84AB65
MKIPKDRIEHTQSLINEGWCLKLLSMTVLSCMASSVAVASDLQIYQGATYGNAAITMMVDNSGSMGIGSIGDDYSANGLRITLLNNVYYCVRNGNTVSNPLKVETITQPIFNDFGNITPDTVSYTVNYCEINNTKYYDRIARLKLALIPLFANPRSNSEGFGRDIDFAKYKIGLGYFYYTGTESTGNGGKVNVPAKPITLEHRKVLINEVIGLSASTNTPIAKAYAEAGAYMLGTNTANVVNEKRYTELGYIKDTGGNGNQQYQLRKCLSNKSQFEVVLNFKIYRCNDNNFDTIQTAKNFNQLTPLSLGNYDYDYYSPLTRSEIYYNQSKTQVWNDNLESGFIYSSDGTKIADKTKYDSPIAAVAPGDPQCNGQGVYFLTDGEPNYGEGARELMNKSLSTGPTTLGATCEAANITGNDSNAWQCIGEYAKTLYDKNSNIKNASIATATAGFGASYQQLSTLPKLSTDFTFLNGVTKTIDVYDCANASTESARNLCRIGERNFGYGNGGFYYVDSSQAIANSIKDFLGGISRTTIDPISAGSMSVPLDSLGGLRSRQLAYLPILEPIPKSNNLWNGNLKKYKVKNSTLVGADNKFVFKNNDGQFADNTHDLWNTIIDTSRPDTLRPDKGLPQIGGTYQKVFENGTSPTTGSRNLFVDSGSSLANLKVTADKPVNFTDLTGYSNPQKIALLKFMGFSVPANSVIADATALTTTRDKGLKNIGAVLHSVPQLITQKVQVDADGRFNTSSREDYLLYGSMDGALHMIDDSTGKETFTFVPKQVLELQPDALANKGSAADGSYPYGVDAPWLTYVSYDTKSRTTGTGATQITTNTYEADQSFALGGLRMGGSMYYALNVTDVNAPSMVYGVGSNYANKLQNSALELGGTKNNVTGLLSTGTAEQKAFARMGQTWGKPTLGYVKSGGKKVMVSFLPGGYDTCYEDTKFKLNTSYPNDAVCNNKSAAQGNAVYMVQMGEVKSTANQKDTIDTTNGGKLLWWANNEGTASDSTSRESSLQYSRSADLKHSVVTQIRVIDRNYDGLIDHIYFADLGGQVWRVDINNNKDTDNFKVDRVVKILDVSNQASGDDAPPRIYERPLVTFYNGKYSYTDAANPNTSANYSGVQAMVTVGTGDRSNPTTATRNVANALYSVIDKDVTRKDLFYYKATGTAPTISLRTPVINVNGTTRNAKLQKMLFTSADIGASGIKTNMQSGAIQGWYMPFTTWLGTDAAVRGKYGIKMFNEPDAIDSVLISSSYDPDQGQAIEACSAGVIGATQRERTCLPYGVCLDNTGTELVTPRSTFNAGLGIVDNIIGQFNETSTFTSLKNKDTCEGEACLPPVIGQTCTGPTCGVNSGINTEKRINPLSWLEF